MWIFPIIMLIVMVIIVKLIFDRGWHRPPWSDSDRFLNHRGGPDTALEILKNRYAKGEITKEEYEQTKKDILN